MRTILPAAVAALLLAAPALAEDAKKEQLTTDPHVTGSQMPEPNAQGIRSPQPLPGDDQNVQGALRRSDDTPRNLQGQTVAPFEQNSTDQGAGEGSSAPPPSAQQQPEPDKGALHSGSEMPANLPSPVPVPRHKPPAADGVGGGESNATGTPPSSY